MNQVKVDNHILRLSGTAYLDSEPTRGKTLVIGAELQETKREEVDNNDGTIDRFYHYKPLRILEKKDGGEAIPIKVKNKNSVRIRAAVFRAHADLQKEGDADSFYDKFTDALCANPEAVINLLDI